ncbi:Putative major facilitator superfamily, MFS transporter superfamily [Septoria linicola]|uniref:Major facilitator superfamily, MFS transporter superfamily n=1 Tax=Septoria linicola TaxID=215465 RepID=A0A9Q9ATR9_9PEZI|nr:putative major facilitator superfamily, MFS transporter superfamily [Septoria linicola]USW53033.1 Putative major facilitator superfamily, MFS transporter superfamily [Septoria linicola]
MDKEAVVQVEYAEQDGKHLNDTQRGGGVHLIDENGQVRRIPIPSADPNDPLNFNKWRKLGIIVCCCWFSVFSLVLVGGFGPIVPVILELYAPKGYAVQEIINLTTYPSLVMACGAFVILPLSMVFGRRPVFLLCTLLLLGTTIGAGVSKSFETHMAMRILQGFATGATESVLPLIITDISFLDERGLWFGVYWGTQNLINAVFTISVSYLVADSSWRWFYYTFAILCGFGMLLAIFLLPETRYDRSLTSYNGQVLHTDEFGVATILSSVEATSRFGTHTPHTTSSNRALLKMSQSLTSPAVLWAILASSISLGCGIAISLTYASVLQQSFHWSPASTGLVNVGIFPASLLAMFYAATVYRRQDQHLSCEEEGRGAYP